ncbi:MAG: DUF5996 family protein [Ginsengibacter sp.]
MSNSITLQALPLEEWEQTKITLHLYLQILGKIQLALMPRKNHWWNITDLICPTGITTHDIPYQEEKETFQITLNILQHKLEVCTSKKEHESFPLQDGVSVAEFYKKIFGIFEKLNIPVKIIATPYDVPAEKKPFYQIDNFHFYQPEYIERFWRILVWVSQVFDKFGGRFYGKTSPVQLYWHHMDLVVTRFSGRKTPPLPHEAKTADKDAYSHEVISFGFWAGDEKMRAPAFYCYTYPSPEGLAQQALQPATAKWQDNNGSPMAMLMYDDIYNKENPEELLLSFMESAYTAGATLAGWNMADFKVPELVDL